MSAFLKNACVFKDSRESTILSIISVVFYNLVVTNTGAYLAGCIK